MSTPTGTIAGRPVVAGLIAAVVVVAVAVGSRVVGHDVFARAENASLDARFVLRGERPVDPRLVIVALDDDSLREQGDVLAKRKGIARLVRALRAQGARTIAIDALFPDAEHVLPPALVARVEAFVAAHNVDGAHVDVDPDMRSALRLFYEVLAEEHGDEELAAALAGGDVVLAVHAGEAAGFADGVDLTRASYGQVVPGEKMPFVARRVIASLPALRDAAARMGMATLVVDPDDRTARSLFLARSFGTQVLAPFAVQIAAQATGLDRGAVAYDASSHTLLLGDQRFAADHDDALLLNHLGDNHAFRVVPAKDVLASVRGDGSDVVVDHDLAVRDAIVIVGYTELGQDTVRTPFSPQLYGAALHATAVSNLLQHNPLRRAPLGVDIAVVVVAALAAAGVFASRFALSARAQVGAVGALVGLIVAGAVLSFVWFDVVVRVVVPVVVVAAAGVAGLVVAYGREGVLRARLRRTFAHYLSPDVIDELLQNPSALALGGARRELTVLFSDICGFTTLAEQMDPLTLVKFLNTYFTPMTRAVLENKGMLDKYIGDAVMAVFGAPVPRDVHVDDALACVLTMHARLRELQAQFPGLAIGIGLNTGEMVVGNMGSDERFDYTVAGDAVNLASRIEGLTRTYGAFCLVGERTRALASPRFRFREVDLVRVKGKHQPAAFYEVLGDDRAHVVDYADLAAWDAGLAAYRAGDFAVARAAFARFAAQNPSDAAVKLFLARMGDAERAPAGWDGVFDHKSK